MAMTSGWLSGPVTAFGRPPGSNGTLAHAPLMARKSVLVTGDTGGMGKTTAIGLAALGARVGITGRDPARSQAAVQASAPRRT